MDDSELDEIEREQAIDNVEDEAEKDENDSVALSEEDEE